MSLPFQLPHESLGTILLVAWLSVWLVIGLFGYLNTFTRRQYFSIWTGGWLLYAVWLTMQFQWFDDTPGQVMGFLQLACMAASTCCLLWGSVRYFGQPAREPSIGVFLVFLVCWACIGLPPNERFLWIELPMFALFGITSLATGFGFFKLHSKSKFLGSGLAGVGFSIWGLQLIAFPFLRSSTELASTGFLLATTIQWFIASSMIILTLEESRQRHRKLSRIAAGSERRYQRLFDRVAEGVIITNAESLQILEINHAASVLLGLAESDARDLKFQQFFVMASMEADQLPENPDAWFAHIVQEKHFSLIWRDGHPVPAEIDGSLIDYRGQKAYQFVIREEEPATPSPALDDKKCDLLSGIARNLNDPLALIQGYLDLVLNRDCLSPHTEKDIKRARSEAQKASKVVGQFFTSQKSAKEKPASIPGDGQSPQTGPDAVKAGRRPARILVLDDEHALAEMISEMLSMQGDNPEIAHDAREALKLIEHETFDAILSDFRMPQIDGRELFRILMASNPKLARKLIYLTGDIVNEDTHKFLKECGQPFLTKPFRFESVRNAIEGIISENDTTAITGNDRQISTAA